MEKSPGRDVEGLVEGKGKAVPAQNQGLKLLGCPTELVNERLLPALPWAAFHCCLNQGMG